MVPVIPSRLTFKSYAGKRISVKEYIGRNIYLPVDLMLDPVAGQEQSRRYAPRDIRNAEKVF